MFDPRHYPLLLLAVILGSVYYGAEFVISIRGVEHQKHQKATLGMSAAVTVLDNQPQAVAVATVPPLGEQRTFRFLLTGDHVDLTAVKETRGDFHQRRGPLSWQPGMIYGRLLDAAQHVLAEDTLPAPDPACMVLDPHTPGTDGEPKPVMLTATGPVILHFRMPKMNSATHIEIYRLSGSEPTVADEQPVGLLLARILLKP